MLPLGWAEFEMPCHDCMYGSIVIFSTDCIKFCIRLCNYHNCKYVDFPTKHTDMCLAEIPISNINIRQNYLEVIDY
jgi:hypothetical protein